MALLPAPGGTRVKPPNWRDALALRSQALNSLYGLGKKKPPSGRTPGLGGPISPDDPGSPTYGINPAAVADATVTGNPGDPGFGKIHTDGPRGPGSTPVSITVPGYDPDYAALISGDPNLIAGEADLGFYTTQIEAARRNAVRKAIIQAGLDPGGVGDVDDLTRQAAAENQFSTMAEVGRGRTRGRTDAAAALAARGILGTGEGALQGAEGRIQENYERSTTQLTQALLDRIAGYETDFAGKAYDVGNRRAALRNSAAERIQKDPRYQPVGEATGSLDAETGAYVTPDGRWYSPTGERLAGKPAPGAYASVAPPVTRPRDTIAPPIVEPPVLSDLGLVGLPQIVQTPELDDPSLLLKGFG